MGRGTGETSELSGPDAGPDETLTCEMERRLALITARYPDRFDETQIGQIRKQVERTIRLSRTLHTVKLANGDSPELIVTTLPPGTVSQ